MFFLNSRDFSCVYFWVRIVVRVRVCLMHVRLEDMVRFRVTVRVWWWAYNWLHVIKGEQHIRDIVLLSSYLYICACEYVCLFVQFHRCVHIWWGLCIGEFVHICVCVLVCLCVCLSSQMCLFMANIVFRLSKRHYYLVQVKCVLMGRFVVCLGCSVCDVQGRDLCFFFWPKHGWPEKGTYIGK